MKLIILIMFTLVTSLSLADEPPEDSNLPKQQLSEPQASKKTLKKLLLGEARGSHSLRTRIAQMQGRTPPARRMNQVVTSSVFTTPTLNEVSPTPPTLQVKLAPPSKTMCQTIFFTPSLTPLANLLLDYPIGYRTHLEPDFETRHHLMWTNAAIHHVLQLKTLGGIKAGEYEAFGKVGDEILTITSQKTFDLFVREVFRVMAFDPSLELALRQAELTLPYVSDSEITPPTLRGLWPAITIRSRQNAQKYLGTPAVIASINQDMHLEPPGILVWAHRGIRHELYLRESRDPYKERGTYRALAQTTYGSIDVTTRIFQNNFAQELHRVTATNLVIARALRFAGIRY